MAAAAVRTQGLRGCPRGQAALTAGAFVRKTPAMFGSRSPLRSAPLLPRACSLALVGAMLIAAIPATSHAAPTQGQIEQLYNEGDTKNSAGDFKGAADAWGRLLVLLPEEQANLATRENLLLNILDAYLNAYLRMPGPDGKKDIEHLREGKTTFELYLKQYRAVYGSGRAISAAVQQKADELNAALAKAEDELKGGGATKPDTTPDPKPDNGGTKPDQQPVVLQSENNGIGLIVGGSITAALGFGALGMLIAGAVGAPRAETDYELAQAEATMLCPSFPNTCSGISAQDQARIDTLQNDLDDADRRGKTANALTIAGAVLTPVLLGAGAAMLAIGIKRNRASHNSRSPVSLSPALGRGFAGLSLSGRF